MNDQWSGKTLFRYFRIGPATRSRLSPHSATRPTAVRRGRRVSLVVSVVMLVIASLEGCRSRPRNYDGTAGRNVTPAGGGRRSVSRDGPTPARGPWRRR